MFKQILEYVYGITTSTVYICYDESGLLEHVRIFQIMGF